MSRLRVLHCIYDDPGNPWLGGGGAHRVFELYRRLTEDVSATVAMGAYPGSDEEDREGVRYVPLGVSRPYALSRLTYGRAATALLRSGEYDVGIFDFSVYTPIRVPRGRPVGHVVHMLIGPSARDRWGSALGGLVERRERRMLGRARRVQTTSSWMAERLEPLVAGGADVRVVRSGVDDAFFRVERRESDYILYYGRFDAYQKGLDILLAAAERLLEGHPKLRLVLAGRGRDAEQVARLVRESRLSSRMEVVADPARERVLGLLSGARLLLHPSRFEGLPVVPAEAMAAGVPVVATNVGALEEMVPTDAGTLVAPLDADGLYRAAAALLHDDDVRRRMSDRARAAARAFSWETVAGEHLAHLRAWAGSPS